jgi:hypothetical protein
MALIDTIQQPDLIGLSDAAALAALNVVGVISTDHTLHQWTFVFESLIQQGISPSVALSAPRLLDALGDIGIALDKSITAGIDFASPLTIAQIQLANVTAPAELVQIINGLLAIGTQTGPRWQIPSNGISTQPTLAQIAAARAARASVAETSRITNAWTVVSNALATGSITTFAQAVTLFGGQ